jgi:hypothetical protein
MFQEQRTLLLASEMRLTDGFMAGDISTAIYKAKIAEIRSQQAELERASERTSVSAERLAETVAHTLQLATSLWELYEQFDDTKRAELLRGVFNVVVLDHHGVVGVTLKPSLWSIFPSQTSDRMMIPRR